MADNGGADSTTLQQNTVSPHGASASDDLMLLFYCRNDARTVLLPKNTSVVVGRSFPSEVVFNEPSLSRQHARFSNDGGVLSVRDLDSTNGTWLDDHQIQDARVQTGAILRLGSVTLTVQPAPEGERLQAGVVPFSQLERLLASEISRAREGNHSTSLVMLQRRRHSEQVNGWCPAAVGAMGPLQTAAVYGNDTLAVLLPDTTEQEAARWAHDCIARLTTDLLAGVATHPTPASNAGALLGLARQALGQASVEAPVRRASETDSGGVDTSANAIVVSENMRRVHELARRAARSRLPILVLGETGTGKELVAQLIHRHSPRADAAFRVVNCAALPPSLMEDVLFGHEAGAFTGAAKAAPGLFEQANGGTLFFDEVGELSSEAQAALLRVLETMRFTRLGETREREVDVRVVAATHRDLSAMVAEGKFREDLFHRLNTVTLTVPPLRARPEEIPLLAERFLHGDTLPDDCPQTFSDAALGLLQAHDWPGNVRQLRNAIERAAVLAVGTRIEPSDLPEEIGDPGSAAAAGRSASTREGEAPGSPTLQPPSPPSDRAATASPFKERVLEYEMQLIRDALKRTGGHKANAAKLLNMPLRTLMSRLERFGE